MTITFREGQVGVSAFRLSRRRCFSAFEWARMPQHAGARQWNGIAHVACVALVWVAAFALATLVSRAGLLAAALPGVIAAAVALAGLRWQPSARLAALAALAAAAFEPSAVLPWTVAAVCLSAVVGDRLRSVSEPLLGELDRYLERCRRRGEPASVLFLDIEADPRALRELLATARVTDSLIVRRAGSRCEVFGLLEEGGETRAKVEARFAEALSGHAPTFGWASYPADGLTLDALLVHARDSVARADAHGDVLVKAHLEPPRGVGFDATMEGART